MNLTLDGLILPVCCDFTRAKWVTNQRIQADCSERMAKYDFSWGRWRHAIGGFRRSENMPSIVTTQYDATFVWRSRVRQLQFINRNHDAGASKVEGTTKAKR
jgi:hypothetical protein